MSGWLAVGSPWLQSPPEPRPALAGQRRVDVAVIGAGFTGLGAALALREEGASVAVIEREMAGFGASGRNAGHLTPTIGKDLATLLRMYGRERTRAFAGFAEAAVEYVEGLIARFEIDCHYHPGGNLLAAVHPSQHHKLERAARAAESLGLHMRHLESEELRKRGLPPAFTAGVLEEQGGVLDPGRLLLGLRQAALDAGAELYEHTPLVDLEEGPSLLLRTPGGTIRADRALLATNAYTTETRFLRHTSQRVWVSLFRTGVLDEAQRDALGWRGREGIYTAHEILESYRWTADGRILGGSKAVRYGYGGRALPEQHPPTFRFIETAFRERFPELDLPIERFWSGPIALTLDFLPALGATGRFRNLLYAVGYNGHGVAQASFAGRVLADWIAGRDSPGMALVERRSWPLPPEPLRWLLTNGLSGALASLDRRLDRKAREARSSQAG